MEAGHGYAEIQRQLMRGRWMISASLRDSLASTFRDCLTMELKIDSWVINSLEAFEPGLGN